MPRCAGGLPSSAGAARTPLSARDRRRRRARSSLPNATSRGQVLHPAVRRGDEPVGRRRARGRRACAPRDLSIVSTVAVAEVEHAQDDRLAGEPSRTARSSSRLGRLDRDLLDRGRRRARQERVSGRAPGDELRRSRSRRAAPSARRPSSARSTPRPRALGRLRVATAATARRAGRHRRPRRQVARPPRSPRPRGPARAPARRRRSSSWACWAIVNGPGSGDLDRPVGVARAGTATSRTSTGSRPAHRPDHPRHGGRVAGAVSDRRRAGRRPRRRARWRSGWSSSRAGSRRR